MRLTRTSLTQIGLSAIAVFLFMLIGSVPGIMMTGFADKLVTQKSEPLHLKIILERKYLDGEISEEVVEEMVPSLDQVWVKYKNWQLKDLDESQITFARTIDDISPLLKANGYFGITDKGVLTIFNGKPGQSNIIQSFFQIDIHKLESNKQQQLIDGIPIKTKDHYVRVLETFKTYSASGK